MIQLIVAYLLGIIVEYNFGLDWSTFLVLFFISLIIFLSVSNYKRHIKYTPDIFHKVFLYLGCGAVFVVSSIYTKHVSETVSYKYMSEGVYEIVGSIVSVKQGFSYQTMTIEVNSLINLEKENNVGYIPKYINTNVSLFNQYKLFDKVKIVGELKPNIGNSYYEDKPFLFNYEFMKLSENVFYTVNYPKNVEQIFYEKNIYETLHLKFMTVSEELKESVSLHMQEPYAAIASGISTGEQSGLSKDVKDIFKSSGLIHILVLSGANVALIISFVWILVQRFRTNYVAAKVGFVILISWIFIFATGLTAPSVRAGVMASASILAEYFRKNISPLYSIFLALFVLTILNPLLLVQSASLHLSFLACISLFMLAPKIEDSLKNKFPKTSTFVLLLVATFLSLFFIMTPYILSLTGQSPIFGTLLTFLVEPFIIISTVLTFILIFTAQLNIYLADIIGLLNSMVVKIILSVANFGANILPQIYFQIPKSWLIIYYLLILIIFYSHEKANKVSSPKLSENQEQPTKVQNGIIDKK